MSSSKHPPQHQYPPELRERAVRMVQEAIAESGERFGAVVGDRPLHLLRRRQPATLCTATEGRGAETGAAHRG
jgi:hypothetical protein